MQHPGRDQGLSVNDEDLLLFQEMQKSEIEAAPPLHQRSSVLVPPESAGDDIFSSSEWDNHDYDWLMTPSTAPLLANVEQNTPPGNSSSRVGMGTVKKSPTPIAKVGSLRSDSSRVKLSAQAARRSFDAPGPAEPSFAPVTVTSLASRKSLSAATRSSTPSHCSTSMARPNARSSTPSKAAPSSATKFTSSFSSVHSKAPTMRASSPLNLSGGSSRPLTPINRSVTPTRVSGSLPASSKPASVSKTTTVPVKRVSSMRPANKAQVPAPHSVSCPEVPHKAQPNVRSSAADRSLSNPRGSLAAGHKGSTAAFKATQSQSGDVGSRDRESSRAAMVARGRVTSNSLDMGKSFSRHEKPCDATIPSLSHSAGSRMVGKNAVQRKPVSSAQRETHSVVDSSAKKAVQPTSPHDKKPSSAARQSSGFGRNLSKKSLDMALRHMDIGRDTSRGVQSFMSNVPTSSLYSVRSRNIRAIPGGHGNPTSSKSRLPMATSNNASSDHGLRVVIDLDGSELGDETSSSRASPVSQPDPSMAMSNERKVSCWLGNPDYMDDGSGEIMKNFEHELASVSGTESPLGSIDCGDFTLQPI